MKRQKQAKPIKSGETKKINYRSKNGRLKEKISEIESKGSAALEKMEISANLEDNKNILKEIFKNCSDIVFRSFKLGNYGLEGLIVFFNDMADKNVIDQIILKQLMFGYTNALCCDSGTKTTEAEGQQTVPENSDTIVLTIRESILSAGEVLETKMLKDTVGSVMEGSCALFFNTIGTAFTVKASGVKGRNIGDPLIEQTVRGPQEGFVESLDTNLSMMRKRLKTPELKTESHIVGTRSNTKLIIAYLNGIADGDIIKEAKKRISEVDIDVVVALAELRAYMADDPKSPFPLVDFTERPDVCVAALAEGRIALFLDGTPAAMLAPTTFAHLFNVPDDYYDVFYFSTFVRILRYIAFFITLMGPSLYIAITTFHPEMIPQSLLISILTSRSDVPFPAVLEALLMELTFEIIREVSIRMPKNLGQSLSIIGGLVVGQLSVQAGIVSTIMIVVVAVTGLTSFLIPKLNSMRQISVLRFPMMVLAAFFGIFGLIMGGLIMLIHLASLRSLGVPYLAPFAPFDSDGIKDTIIRLPFWEYTKRPPYIQNNDVKRMKVPKRPNTGKNDQ